MFTTRVGGVDPPSTATVSEKVTVSTTSSPALYSPLRVAADTRVTSGTTASMAISLLSLIDPAVVGYGRVTSARLPASSTMVALLSKSERVRL